MAARILITGASTGIGAATAREMAPGNTIFLHYNTSEREAGEVAVAVKEAGGTPHLLQADLSEKRGAELLAEQMNGLTDALDLLVNNAGGIVKRETLDEMEWDTMVETFTLNAFSTFMVTRWMLPLLRAGRRPQVINVTSVAMRTGSPTAIMYASSKGAVDTFTRGAAKTLAPQIRVNAIAPGVIATPFHDKATSPDQFEQFKAATPLQIVGPPEEVAQAVRFLHESSFITGATIDVNGGMHMR